MNQDLITLAIQETPQIVDLLRSLFQKQQPDAPVPSEAEVMAAYQVAFTSTLAKDDFWLSTHRE
jgi:hypothetical protein